jgi:DNA-binding LacI/PurR family transcriptional regulator
MAAFAALRAAHQAGWRVPEDLSVVGIDDIQFAAYTNPGLTTVAQPKQELGALAVDAALARAGKQTPAPASDGPASDGGGASAKGPARTLDGHLVVRESTAPAVPRQPVPGDRILRGGSEKELAR